MGSTFPPKILGIYNNFVAYTPTTEAALSDFTLILYHKQGFVISENHYQLKYKDMEFEEDGEFEVANDTYSHHFVVRYISFFFNCNSYRNRIGCNEMAPTGFQTSIGSKSNGL
jgi:hypothetical protein